MERSRNVRVLELPALVLLLAPCGSVPAVPFPPPTPGLNDAEDLLGVGKLEVARALLRPRATAVLSTRTCSFTSGWRRPARRGSPWFRRTRATPTMRLERVLGYGRERPELAHNHNASRWARGWTPRWPCRKASRWTRARSFVGRTTRASGYPTRPQGDSGGPDADPERVRLPLPLHPLRLRPATRDDERGPDHQRAALRLPQERRRAPLRPPVLTATRQSAHGSRVCDIASGSPGGVRKEAPGGAAAGATWPGQVGG